MNPTALCVARLQGADASVTACLAHVAEGPRFGRVDGVATDAIEVVEGEAEFETRRG